MSKKIDRRAVIGGLATGTAAAAVSAPAYAQGKRRLKM
ncbi:MAG: twin-arginine translocation signal domain-containing protein, partial [Parvibaculales bacterium]